MSIITCRGRNLDYSRKTLVMGILNVTPDSFSDGGVNYGLDDALRNAYQMVQDGVDIIDVGGESTRPGFTPVSDEEEIARIVPVISKISNLYDVTISVDTYKSAVARAALEAGAHIINDISALEDESMASLVSEYDAGLVLMYNARRFPVVSESDDIVLHARKILENQAREAISAGVNKSSIIMDPGIGFGTTRQQDYELINRVGELSIDDQYAVLLALSRKRVVADVMGGTTTPDMRDEASLGLALAGINKGANMVRVHNVNMTVKALKGFDYIAKGEF